MSTTKKLSEELDEEGLENSTWDFGRAADEARALEERVGYYDKAGREMADHLHATLARAEAAEAERKEFMLETQRKEIECNELASEVARLREDSTWRRVEEAEGLYMSMRDERDALRAKLAKVRAYAECSLEDKEHSMSILRILDGEGGDEA